MNKNYTYIISLQDKFSPVLQRLTTAYSAKVGAMQRVWDKFSGIFNRAGQSADSLRKKLSGLGTNHRLKLDSSDIDRADRKASGLMFKLKGLAGGALLGGIVGGGVAGLASNAISMLQQQIGTGLEKTVGAAQRSQATMFSLSEIMGKSGASNLTAKIDNYAPERRDQFLTGATRLAGAGMDGNRIMDTLYALNNMVAVSGGKASIDDLSYIVSKINSAGRVQGEEKEMLTDRGININPYLAKVMGVKETQLKGLQEKGLITSDIFQKAIQAYGGKGGRYDGAYDRYKVETVDGREQAVNGRRDVILRNFGKKILPIKEAFLDVFESILKWEGPVVSVFQKIWGAVSPLFEAVGGLLQRLGILNEQWGVSKGLMNTITFLWDYFGQVMKVVGGVVWVVAKAIGFLINNPVTAFLIGATAAVWAFNLALAANPIGQVITGITALVAGVMYAYDKFDWFREGILRSWEMIKSVFANIGGFLLNLFAGNFSGAVAILGKAISGGVSAGDKVVNNDRVARILEKQKQPGIVDRRAGRRTGQEVGGIISPGSNGLAPGGITQAAGLSSTVGNSKSNSVTINIGKLIEKSEINVHEMGMAMSDLEGKIIETLVRAANSGARMVTA